MAAPGASQRSRETRDNADMPTVPAPSTAPGYVRGYHLTSAEHAISTIALGRVKLARMSEVNDPFELMALDCLKMTRRKALEGFRSEQDGKIGMLCFSHRWSNPVLWSHYADSHKGICLGFDVHERLGVKGVRSVEYAAEKFKLDDDQDAAKIPAAVQEALLWTKFKHWQYEEELRAFIELSQAVKESGRYFYRFGEDLRLREVILGPLCPSSQLAPIRQLTRALGPAILVSRARLGFKFFEVKEDSRYKPEP
jgi:hypothetical protein